MGKVIDILGGKFGRLTVVEFVGLESSILGTCGNGSVWKCRCDCGKETFVRGKHLRSGRIVSCGCFRLEQVTKALHKDLSGKRFGRLVALSVDHNDRGTYYWKCKCDCGNETVVAGNKLAYSTRSCGCLMREAAKRQIAKLIKKQRGKNHPRWNPLISNEDRKLRVNNHRLDLWRTKVYQRDGYTCRKCNDSTGRNLNAHHVYSWNTHKTLRYVVNNGITLCEDCHKGFHHKYGYGNNTRRQLSEYMRVL